MRKFIVAILFLISCGTTLPQAYAVSTNLCSDTDTVFLLHAGGADTSTTFTDSSISGHSVTANADAQVDTGQSKFGGSSILLDGTGDYLSSADSADWALNGDFTIETWVRIHDRSVIFPVWNQRQDGNNLFVLFVKDNVDQLIEFDVVSGGVTTISKTVAWNPTADTWYHLVLSHASTSWKVFVDGTQVGTTLTDSDNVPDLSAEIRIGEQNTNYANGWLDEFRVVKGTAVWTTTFTSPVAAYADTCSTRRRIFYTTTD